MSVLPFVPRYQHRPVSVDEMIAKEIQDPLNPMGPMPTRCNRCKREGTAASPLMMKPYFRMDHGGPRGTLYQAWCGECYMIFGRSR